MILKSWIWLSLFACILCYSQTLKAPLLWDDENFIRFNPGIQTVASLPHFIFHPEKTSKIERYNVSIFRPLRTFLFSIQYFFFGDRGFGYHLFSLILHLLNGVLIFLLLKKLTLEPWSWILSTLWLLHPIQTEAVSFVSSQGDLLVTFFFLLNSLLLFVPTQTKRDEACWAFLYFILITLTLLSKETGVMAFVVQLFILLFLPLDRERKNGRIWIVLLVGGLSTIAYLFLRYELLGKMTQIDSAPEGVLQNLLFSVPKTYLSYFSILFAPFNLSALYSAIRWTGLEFFTPLLLGSLFLFGLRPKKIMFLGGALVFSFPSPKQQSRSHFHYVCRKIYVPFFHRSLYSRHSFS